MELFVTILGWIGVIPLLLMGFFYTVIPLLLFSLQAIGAVETWRQGSAPAEATPQAQPLDQAA